MTTAVAAGESRSATLSTWDTVSVIVGIVIGASIYETPPLVFGNVPNGTWAMVAWGVGGLLCLNGAFTYAELASTYPRSGGDYVYLSRAFGPWLGFLFGWAQISVILTGSIGMMA
jgi:amino acid transporter